ncbi:hypothetical protein DFJ73DRAFT_888126 [Zopfochytrium polystomum]|nr:hypothetical protein DFJ73DRAFT_888126 [Zopfochytrium polystomum]
MEAKLQSTSRQLATIRAQVQSKERERRISELSVKELDQYPRRQRRVQVCGQNSDLPTLKKALTDKAANNEKEIKVLQKAAKKLENEASDAEYGMRRLLAQREAASS